MKPPASQADGKFAAKWSTAILVLAGVLLIFYSRSFLPGQTLFSNDGPLGRISADYHHPPESFTGVWNDLNSAGYREQGALTSVTYGLQWLLGNLAFSKFYQPIGLLIAGLGAWYFFRESGLAGPACILGGVATSLNMDFFSTACWGIAAVPIAVGMAFFALAALMKTTGWRGWVRTALAGLAVGMGVADAADVGAIFSLFVAAFIVYDAWVSEGAVAPRLAVGAGRLVIVVLFAVLLAAQPIAALINTQIKDVAGLDETLQTPADHWNWATQWSLPKREALSLVVPSLFGYRLDTVGGGTYWGDVGRDPAWEKYYANGQQGEPPKGLKRFVGSGIYCGVTVVLLAVWAFVQLFGRQNSVFDRRTRRRLWFWTGAMLVSLLLGFGRHAPFYQFIYRLPFFSTIRNPIKFLEVVNFCLIILFAYGADGLWRRYMRQQKPAPSVAAAAAVKSDRRWLIGTAVFFMLSLIAWAVYAGYRENVEEYLLNQSYSDAMARAISTFSVAQVGWFVLFFALMAGTVAWILRGGFTGKSAIWGATLLGLWVVLDLGHADGPWVIYWDYVDKYADNPILQMLEDKPYEHRVTIPPYRTGGPPDPLVELYRLEWLQQLFPYRNIQAVDLVQLPRTPRDLREFMDAVKFDGSPETFPRLVRRFELMNARYIMSNASYADFFNDKFDPIRRSMRTLVRFNLVPKRNSTSTRTLERMTAEISPTGAYAVFEFVNALPRAKLFTNWQVETNERANLARVVDPAFDVSKTVLLSENLPASVAPSTNAETSPVSIVSYAPKKVTLNATNSTPAVLLLNDRFDPNWQVTVDGKASKVLRCNFLMRGVYLEPGAHVVEFTFRPPFGALYVSIAGMAAGILMLGVITFSGDPVKASLPVPEEAPAAGPPPAVATPAAPAMSKKARRRLEKSKR